ncbi:hypothetical protein MHU86_21406 [Fragilaria crotonensis]|nr:hypothetical protein MHU86_21406 [Fragilaria crotonensis]
MTVREPPSQGGNTAPSPTGSSHPSLNQETSTTATSTTRDSAFASTTTRSKGQASTNDPGATPVIPSTSMKASLDENTKKEYSKLQHASATRPFAPSAFASIPNEPDRDLASKRQARNPEVDDSVPGAIPVFPKENTNPSSRREDLDQTSFTVADNNMATQSEIHIPHAFSVDDAHCYAEAVVTNDVENGDAPTETEPPKRWSPAKRYGIIAAVLVVIALIVTLVVVFAVKPSGAKSQFVQYQVAWSASLSPNFSPSTVISDLELTCQASGTLKSPVITSLIGERPVCPATSDSTILCTQTPFQQTDSVVVVDALISFQCHGTSPDQLVGQATLFDTTITYSGGTFGFEYGASQLMVLQTIDAKTGTPVSDSQCSDMKLIFPNPSDPTNSTSLLICGSYDTCVSDGVNECEIFLQLRSEVQRSPVNSIHIQDE